VFQSQEGIFCDKDNLVCGGAGTCLPKSMDGVIVNDLDGNPLTFRYQGCQCPELAIEGKCQIPHWDVWRPVSMPCPRIDTHPPPLLLPVGMTYSGEYCMDVQVDTTGGDGGGGGGGGTLLLIAIIAGAAAALGIAYTIFTK
jgi:hypothetical protein